MATKKTPAAAALAAADAPIVPTTADATAVAEAAKALDTPDDDATAKDRALTEAAEGFDAAAAAAAADAPVVPVAAASAADAAREEAQALADALNEQEPEAEGLKDIEFPCVVRVLNHSHVSMTEKVSGAFLAAGGSATVHLPDADHASAVRDSLQSLAVQNYLAPGALAVQAA